MKHKLKWYKLDTSAKIYPALESIRNTAIFRVSITLKKTINPNLLLEALDNIVDRFPYYNVHIKKGLFWSYLEQNTLKPFIWKDIQSPCSRMHPHFNHNYLYKVKYFNKRVALEMFHVLTDGTGAIEFLKCLIAEYLLLKGEVDEIDTNFVVDKNEDPKLEEYEDAFLRVLEDNKDKLPEEKKRSLLGKKDFFKLKDRQMPIGKYRVITGIASVQQLKEASKKHNATITQLIASLYLEALIHLQAEQEPNVAKHKNVSVQVPVNMRGYYPIKCMRNFSLFVIPCVNPREIKSLDDIVEKVKVFMKEHLTEDHLLTMVEDNCSLAQNFFVRYVPLFIKNLIIRFANNTSGSTQFSGTLSNLGVLKMQDDMKDSIDYVDFILGPSSHQKCSCSMASYKDKATLTFGNSIKSTYIPKYIFTELVKMGVEVEVKNNY